MLKLTCKFPTIYHVFLIVLKHYLLILIISSNNSVHMRTVDVLTTNLGIKIVRKGIPTRRSVAFLQLWPNGWMNQDAT